MITPHDLVNFKHLSEIILTNNVLVDVGANDGDYSDFFVNKLNGSGKVYTIELHPNTSNKLSLKYKDRNNVTVLNKAVSNIDGSVVYYEGVDSCTHNIIGYDMLFRKNKSLGEIESIRLDTLLKDEEIINVIKIDVEGAELKVLEGIENISNKVNYIMVECHLDEDWDEIRNLLFKYKFSCINTLENTEITESSKRPYQCLCKKQN